MSPVKVIQNRPMWILAVLVLLATGLGAVSARILTRDVGSNSANLDDVCLAQNDATGVLRGVLELSQAQQSKEGTYPVVLEVNGKQRPAVLIVTKNGRTDKFYADALKLAKPIKC